MQNHPISNINLTILLYCLHFHFFFSKSMGVGWYKGTVHMWGEWWRDWKKGEWGCPLMCFAACQPLLREDLVWSVRIRAYNYFAKCSIVRTVNLRGLCWSGRQWVARPRSARCCYRELIRGDVLLSASLSPTLSQMSTRWKEWRKSSISVEKRQGWMAMKAQCVFLFLCVLLCIVFNGIFNHIYWH